RVRHEDVEVMTVHYRRTCRRGRPFRLHLLRRVHRTHERPQRWTWERPRPQPGGGTMGLSREDRVNAIAQFRYTERQARFLELVLRHGGVCVPRQYATVAGIANGGEKCTALFEKIVSRHHAVASDCRHNRARVYHVHYQRLYAAIGEPDSRYRRPVPSGRAMERVM